MFKSDKINKGELNMNKIELNDLHIRVLSEIPEDVKNYYDEQTFSNKLRVKIATNILTTNILNMIKTQQSNDQVDNLESIND